MSADARRDSSRPLSRASIWKKYGFAWVTGLFFAVSLAAHWALAWGAYASEQRLHGEEPRVGDYLLEVGRDRREGEDTAAIERMFTPEFRNRLDATISFAPLSKDTIHQVVEKFVLQLEAQLMDRNVHIELSPEAADWLGDKGYDDKMGARPLGRVIQEHLKKPLAEELLFGKLQKGGVVRVGVKDEKLDLQIEATAPPRLTGSKPPLLTAE